MPAKPTQTDEVNRLQVNVDDDDDFSPPPSPPSQERQIKRAPRRSKDNGKVGTATVYVSLDVDARLDEYRRQKKGRKNLHILIDAIDATHPRLAEIIENSKVSTAPTSSIFPADPKAVRYLGGGPVPFQFSPTPEQAQFLDDLGNSLGFTKRSTWIAPVLNEFLPTLPDSTTTPRRRSRKKEDPPASSQE